MRLDHYLVQRKFFETRSQANQAIKRGVVKVWDKVCTKPALKILKKTKIEITEDQYVSRSAHKLKFALDEFQIKPSGKVCLDIGSSTGGFTEVLIEQSANKVVAVDVGTNQMHDSLKSNGKIELHENTDIRDFESGEKFELIVGDISFISLKKIIPSIKKFINAQTKLVLLFKPQFEVGKDKVKKGLVKEKDTKEALKDFEKFLEEQDLKLLSKQRVPLKGKKGNQEWVLLIT